RNGRAYQIIPPRVQNPRRKNRPLDLRSGGRNRALPFSDANPGQNKRRSGERPPPEPLMDHEEGSDRGEYGFARENQRRVRRGGMPLSPHEKRIRKRGCENRRNDYAKLHLKCEADKEMLQAGHI